MTDLDTLWRVIELKRSTPGTVRTHGTGLSTANGEILAAVDENGARALLFPTGDDDPFAPDLSTRVHLTKRRLQWAGGEGQFATVTCSVVRLQPVFTTLAEDMLEAAEGAACPGAVLRRVLDDWRDLLSAEPKATLSRQQVVGLVAELLTLRELLRHDPTRDVGVWTGPHEDPHDFRRGADAIEVKGSLHRDGLHVEVHGLQQLEPPEGGRLHLLLHRLEEDRVGELSLPDLVREILDGGVSRHHFVDLLGRAGYDLAREADYTTQRFRLVETRAYRVDENFPRIVPGSFRMGAAPAGVIRVQYVVDLTGPSPAPMDQPEFDRLVAHFGDGGPE